MFKTIIKRRFQLAKITVVVGIVFVSAATGAARFRTKSTISVDTPVYTGYKGVTIGMTTEEARKKLGSPKEKADDRDYFVFSDNESVQLYYDAEHKVSTISVTYIGKMSQVPTAKDVLGTDEAAKPDGSISKLVRYPKAGFWLSYNKTAGDDPIVMITMQKINPQAEN